MVIRHTLYDMSNFFSFNPAHKYIFCFIQFWTKRKEKVCKRYFSQFLNNLQTYFYYMPYFFNDVIIWLTWLEGKREWKRGLWDFKKLFEIEWLYLKWDFSLVFIHWDKKKKIIENVFSFTPYEFPCFRTLRNKKTFFGAPLFE